MFPPEPVYSENEMPGIDFVSRFNQLMHDIYWSVSEIQTVVPNNEEGSSLHEIARAIVSEQADRIYIRVRQCDVPSLVMVRLSSM